MLMERGISPMIRNGFPMINEHIASSIPQHFVLIKKKTILLGIFSRKYGKSSAVTNVGRYETSFSIRYDTIRNPRVCEIHGLMS